MSQFKMKTCGLSGTIARTLLCGVAAAATLSIGLDANAAPQKGGTLKVVGTADIDRFDPTSAGLVTTNNFLRPTQRTLISYDSSTDETVRITPVGDLATEVPQPSADGLSYTFTIRDGATWNTPDGARQISSEDVERGIKRMCNPALGSFALTYYTSLIEGMDSFCEGFSKVDPTVDAMKAYIQENDISGITEEDDKTVTFKLKEEAGDFIYMLSLPSATPAPVEVLDYMPDSPDYRDNYIASGPYTPTDYVPDSKLVLERNPSWNAESDPLRAAYVDKIDITFGLQADAAIQQLQAGDADVVWDIIIPPAILQMLTMTGDEKLSTMGVGRTSFIFINTVSGNNDGALKDLKVRQALNYAVDRAAIVQQMGGPAVAAPQHGIFGPGVLGYHDFDLYPSEESKGDPEKAKALLAEAGYPDGITLKMPYRNSGILPAVAQTVQAAMAKAGITLELTPVAPADYYSKFMTNQRNTEEGTWDIAPVGWSPDWVGGAARSVFQPQFTYDGNHQTYNYTDYNNADATALAKKAINATTPEETAKLWGEVDEMVMKDAPVVPMVSENIVLYHGEAVQNFQPYALSAQGDYTNVWLDR
ncbi:peptide/nickel transport system substrate-binding protein [Cohaesibacter marisflavi]|uniref:Peptide/nickel transport system substrate-binding protein n=1 Tax=Cohaesibacter marisflavi TaxID=655353 RepID=A0A1I5KKS1_9HYPH|nr:ABC transporter substrate-binding protein [Cohaesibacter marisflavi]SFO85413.1 peptide/nickel transport system substrate-binding protein [Cohaesibacter marisflavi]